jgi:DNA-directed RNA polymerase subunit RPC12/RpoP
MHSPTFIPPTLAFHGTTPGDETDSGPSSVVRSGEGQTEMGRTSDSRTLPHKVREDVGVCSDANVPTASSAACGHSPPLVLAAEDLSAKTAVAATNSQTVTNSASKSAALKSMHRLSRLNAVDLTVTGAADVEMTTAAERGNVNETTTVSVHHDERVKDSAASVTSSGRVKPSTTKRCEIFPVPGRVSTEGVRVGTSYACQICRKQFSSAPRLALHRNIHYIERPARCPICRSSFASRSLLERHQAIKHGDIVDLSSAADNPRPYKCDECGVAFRIPGHLAKHKRSKSHAARIECLLEPSNAADNETEEDKSQFSATADAGDDTPNAVGCRNDSSMLSSSRGESSSSSCAESQDLPENASSGEQENFEVQSDKACSFDTGNVNAPSSSVCTNKEGK